ncbi:MAG: hypothetical protein JSS02_16605 [Planctomycetes bacterium]|nr:hypothetical protein [Planctomycetota bacterium]
MSLPSAAEPRVPVSHYHWAGLDFLVDEEGTPVFLEANRASHMLGEYLEFFGNDRPFALTAGVMNRASGPPCLLWRRCDPQPDADEDACFIGGHLQRHLCEPARICLVEDNQEPRDELLTREGQQVRPGSIFRWWYGLPWSYERAGVTVINPNSVWLTVRDKFLCGQALAGARTFRVAQSFAINSAAEARQLLAEHPQIFRHGYVLKPRVGWGGYDVQVANPGEPPRDIPGDYLLCERIVPRLLDGRFWEVRMFVMAGVCLGGLRHTNRQPNTNYWQGGVPERLDDAALTKLAPAALEAVERIDAAAARIHTQPVPHDSPLLHVNYAGRGQFTRPGSSSS